MPEDAPEARASLATRRALEALGAAQEARGAAEAPTVLDVGCGGGAAGLALAPPAGTVIGVDESPDMLALFVATAQERGIRHEVVTGRWPDVAPSAPHADVVVCHNVLYNVSDLVPFVLALDGHAGRRVVCEITAHHPLSWLAPLWRHFWCLERPAGPTAEQAWEVVREAGIDATLEVGPPTPRQGGGDDLPVAFARRRLCLGAERDAEIAEQLASVSRSVSRNAEAPRAVIWWDVTTR